MCMLIMGEEEMWDRVADLLNGVLEGGAGDAISIAVERRQSLAIVTIALENNPVAMWGVML